MEVIMPKQVKIIMLIICTIMLVLLNLDYNPFNYTFINNVFLMGLAICFIKTYDLVEEDR
jgi:hypothetical protein